MDIEELKLILNDLNSDNPETVKVAGASLAFYIITEILTSLRRIADAAEKSANKPFLVLTPSHRVDVVGDITVVTPEK